MTLLGAIPKVIMRHKTSTRQVKNETDELKHYVQSQYVL